LSCLVAVSFAQCPTGYTNKQSAVSTKCPSDAKNCAINSCCTLKSTTCYANGVVCTGGLVEDPKKRWNQAGATAAEKQKNCCGAKATCADVKCTAGYEAKYSPPSSQKCSGAVSTCSGCCKIKTGTCGAEATNICDAGFVKDSKKNGNIAGDATARKTNCCTKQATCADVKCTAGYEAKYSTPSSQKCPGPVSVCSGCCKAKTGTCAAQASNMCASGFYKDPKKNGNTAGDATARKTNCCTAQATCTQFWAYKPAKKAGTSSASTAAGLCTFGWLAGFLGVALN